MKKLNTWDDLKELLQSKQGEVVSFYDESDKIKRAISISYADNYEIDFQVSHEELKTFDNWDEFTNSIIGVSLLAAIQKGNIKRCTEPHATGELTRQAMYSDGASNLPPEYEEGIDIF